MECATITVECSHKSILTSVIVDNTLLSEDAADMTPTESPATGIRSQLSAAVPKRVSGCTASVRQHHRQDQQGQLQVTSITDGRGSTAEDIPNNRGCGLKLCHFHARPEWIRPHMKQRST